MLPAHFSTQTQRKSNFHFQDFGTCFSFTVFLLLFSLHASAQRYGDRISYGEPASDYGIRFGAAYDSPLGDLSSGYRGGAALDVSAVRYWRNFEFSLGLGYGSYSPKTSTYTVTANDGLGDVSSVTETISYDTFSSVMLIGGAAYNIPLTDSFSLYGGLNFGDCWTSYGLSASTSDGSSYSQEHYSQEEDFIAPKAGVGIMFPNNIKLSFEVRYNIFYSPASFDYNTRDGYSGSAGSVNYKSLAAGLSLTYRFP